MKTTTIIISILIGCTVFFVASYSRRQATATEVVVLKDVTDSMLSEPDKDGIFSLYDLEKSKWNGAVFRFVDLSEVSLNTVSEIKLDAANEWLSNELERETEVKNFKRRLSKIISVKGTVGRTHSSLYLPIARELNRLSRSKSNKSVLLVYSDLMENTPDISFYDKKSYRLFLSNPDSLKNLFEKMQPLNPLTGIEVHFIFQPADTIQDKEFQAVSEFYRKLLEDKGAEVTISANL